MGFGGRGPGKPPGNTGAGKAANHPFNGMTTTQIRAQLRAMNYNVDPSGPMTPRLQQAMNWFKSFHKVQPNLSAGDGSAGWNSYDQQHRFREQQKIGGRGPMLTGEDPSVPPVNGGRSSGTKPVQTSTKTKVKVNNNGGNNGPVPTMTDAANFGLSDLPDPNVMTPISVKNAKMGAQPIGLGYADNLAGMQFDPQIQQARQQMGYIQPDLAQHLQDFDSWYGQVQGALGKSHNNMVGDTAAITKASGNATQGILNSLGGDAFAGATTVADQGVQNAGELAATGKADTDFMSQLSPLIAAEAAAGKRGETTRMNNIYHDYATQVQNLLGQRGQAKGAAELQIKQGNNQILDNRLANRLHILEYNRSAKQQNWSNANESQKNAIAAALGNIQIEQAKQSLATGGVLPWGKLDGGTKLGIIKSALDQITTNGHSALPVGQMYKQAYALIRGMVKGSASDWKVIGPMIKSRIDVLEANKAAARTAGEPGLPH